MSDEGSIPHRSRGFWGEGLTSRGVLLALLLGGGLVHVGTALLRLSTFVPSPRLLDFASFYVGARSLSAGVSAYPLSLEPPYRYPAEWLQRFLPGVGLTPEVPASTPVWLFLLRPFGLLSFEAAAWLWLGLQIALALAVFRTLASMAEIRGARSRWVAFVAFVTFGPLFLTLTLGQSSLVVLAAALLVGRALRRRLPFALAVPLWFAAMAAKLSAAVWIAALLPLGRRGAALAGALGLAAVIALSAVLSWGAPRSYWLDVVPTQAKFYSEPPREDDQSLLAWLDRLGRERVFVVPGLSTRRLTTVHSRPPWEIDRRLLRGGAWLLNAALAVVVVVVARRARSPSAQEGVFYLFLLLALLAVPHTERYNHVLLLPAMAWLLPQGETARAAAAAAYFLTGVARLTHLWILALPSLLAVVASGAGVFAVLVLGGAMVGSLRRAPVSP